MGDFPSPDLTCIYLPLYTYFLRHLYPHPHTRKCTPGGFVYSHIHIYTQIHMYPCATFPSLSFAVNYIYIHTYTRKYTLGGRTYSYPYMYTHIYSRWATFPPLSFAVIFVFLAGRNSQKSAYYSINYYIK